MSDLSNIPSQTAHQPQADEQTAARTRTVEMVVAVLTVIVGAVVIYDSRRLGSGWSSDGPAAGYFPFYIGILLCIAGGVNLFSAFKTEIDDVFLKRGQAKLVFSIFAPLVLYVLAIQFLGLYVASTLYIAIFMLWLGKYGWFKTALVSIGTSVVFFLMFEIWFKVPLLKGPLETWLGLN